MSKNETYYLLIENSDEADVSVVYASTNNDVVKKMKTKMENHYGEDYDVDYDIISFNPSKMSDLNKETIKCMKDEDNSNDII